MARLKFDCRSLIALRTNADALLPNPLYGWVSMYSSSTSDMIISPVPKEHLKVTKNILKARGGFVELAILREAAASTKHPKEQKKAAPFAEAPKPDREQNSSSTKGKRQKTEDTGRRPAKPTNDEEADAVAERSQSRKALAGLKEGASESKADKFQSKRAIQNLREGMNVSKADKFQAQKAFAGLKESKNESKAETHQKKKAMEALKSPRRPEVVADVDPAIRAFLDHALEELCATQPDNPLQVLAEKCRQKAVAVGSEQAEPAVEHAKSETPTKSESAASTDTDTVETVEEALRRIKKYHDLGELGVKKLVLQVRSLH